MGLGACPYASRSTDNSAVAGACYVSAFLRALAVCAPPPGSCEPGRNMCSDTSSDLAQGGGKGAAWGGCIGNGGLDGF